MGLWAIIVGMSTDRSKNGPTHIQSGGPAVPGLPALSEPRFIADVNVGKLGKWLRILGYDALFINPIDDDVLVQIGVREGRIVLTKDTHIAERRLATSGQVMVVLVQGVWVRDQLQFLAETLGLRYSINVLSRCIECNVPLEPMDRSLVQGRVPPYVYNTQQHYMTCPRCGKIYWPGTHWQRMREVAEEVLGSG